MRNVHNFSRNNESQTIRDLHVYNVCDVYVKVTKYLPFKLAIIFQDEAIVLLKYSICSPQKKKYSI